MNGPGSRDDPTSIAIGHLTRGVAHDFSNALTSILSSAELLAEATDADDPRRSDIERIRRASLKARTITMQLIDFTKAKAEVASRFSVVERIESRRQLLEHVLERDCELVVEGNPGVQFFGDVHAFDRAVLHWAMD
ncbi:MAG: histidine kinase dimerization/phospho-acceptor domain-containing protein, partial [Myxococcota bacterium]